MKAIYKYEIHSPGLDGTSSVKMVKDAVILSVQLQHCNPTIWALVDPNKSTEYRLFFSVFTGEEFDTDMTHAVHLDTLQAGAIVTHIFELTEP